jgi:hypothetical protein
MAEAQGVDLEETMFRGQLRMSELEDAVLRCTACSSPDSCEYWLSQQKGPVDSAPSYCRNTEMMQDLRRRAQ